MLPSLPLTTRLAALSFPWLLDHAGELFAECPLPSDGTPLPTVCLPHASRASFL
jgi:hypothetical protein